MICLFLKLITVGIVLREFCCLKGKAFMLPHKTTGNLKKRIKQDQHLNSHIAGGKDANNERSQLTGFVYYQIIFENFTDSTSYK